jgi:hypothetical protein
MNLLPLLFLFPLLCHNPRWHGIFPAGATPERFKIRIQSHPIIDTEKSSPSHGATQGRR